MGIQINGQTDIISATDGSLTVSGAAGQSNADPSIAGAGGANTGGGGGGVGHYGTSGSGGSGIVIIAYPS